VTYDIVAYGAMLADRGRSDAYGRALASAIRPGAVVADLGTGSGIMALLACRSGAARVYAVEPGDVIQVAREVAAANGFADRIRFLHADSSEVDLPERVDGIVSDLRGALPMFGRGIASVIDARNRWLKPGGWMIAERDTLWAAPVASPRLHERFAANWDQASGFDFSAARVRAVNHYSAAHLERDEVPLPARCWAELDYAAIQTPAVRGAVEWALDRPLTAHGIGAWFDTVTARGFGFSNSPLSGRHVYRQVFFPWPQAVLLAAGDEVHVSLRADLAGSDYVLSWSTDIVDGRSRQPKCSFRQSTFEGAVLDPSTLRRHAERSVRGSDRETAAHTQEHGRS
jgi:protein arginine N-methyltransferase 1